MVVWRWQVETLRASHTSAGDLELALYKGRAISPDSRDIYGAWARAPTNTTTNTIKLIFISSRTLTSTKKFNSLLKDILIHKIKLIHFNFNFSLFIFSTWEIFFLKILYWNWNYIGEILKILIKVLYPKYYKREIKDKVNKSYFIK